jgi:hypothetical protein
LDSDTEIMIAAAAIDRSNLYHWAFKQLFVAAVALLAFPDMAHPAPPDNANTRQPSRCRQIVHGTRPTG